jgi:hypothetical protein
VDGLNCKADDGPSEKAGGLGQSLSGREAKVCVSTVIARPQWGKALHAAMRKGAQCGSTGS